MLMVCFHMNKKKKSFKLQNWQGLMYVIVERFFSLIAKTLCKLILCSVECLNFGVECCRNKSVWKWYINLCIGTASWKEPLKPPLSTEKQSCNFSLMHLNTVNLVAGMIYIEFLLHFSILKLTVFIR